MNAANEWVSRVFYEEGGYDLLYSTTGVYTRGAPPLMIAWAEHRRPKAEGRGPKAPFMIVGWIQRAEPL